MKILQQYKKALYMILIVCLVVTFGFGQFSPLEAQDQEQAIDALIQEVINQSKVPGIAVSVVSDTQVLYAKGFGEEVIGQDNPMNEHSISAIGSLTKSFTALAMLQLVEAGKVRLEDRVIDYLPSFRTFDQTKSDKITIAMLLNNSSGLLHNSDMSIWEQDTLSTDYTKNLKGLENTVLAFDPGEAFSYSNDGFALAGLIIEKVTGKSYDSVIQEQILTPLEMTESSTDINKIQQMPALYGHLSGIENFIAANQTHLGLMNPAGSEFRSTTTDLGKYGQMLLNHGEYQGKTILSQKYFDSSILNGVVPFEMYGQQLSYGNGWMHIQDTPYIFHPGQTMAMSSVLIFDPVQKISIAVLYNVADVYNKQYAPMNLGLKIMALFHPGEPEITMYLTPIIEAGTVMNPMDTSLVGNYQSQSGISLLSVSEGNGLEGRITNLLGETSFEIHMVSSQKAYIKGVGMEGFLQVLRNANNQVVGLVHPFYGLMSKVRENKWNGYETYETPKVSLSYRNTLVASSDVSEGNIILTGSLSNGKQKGDTVTIRLNQTTYNDDFFSQPTDLKIVDTTLLREQGVGGKQTQEQLYIYQTDAGYMAKIRIGIQGDIPYTLEAEIPFEWLTKLRNEDIVELITSLTTK